MNLEKESIAENSENDKMGFYGSNILDSDLSNYSRKIFPYQQ